jgi:hypothetical protein
LSGKLAFAIDLAFLVAAIALVFWVAFAFLTRPMVPYSVTGQVGMAKCLIQPYPVFANDSLVNTPPHLHIAARSLVATATNIDGLEPPSIAPSARRWTPLGARSFAFLSSMPDISIRVFLLPGRTMTILKPDAFMTADKALLGVRSLSKRYAIGLALDYPAGVKIWTVMPQSADIHVKVFDYGRGERIPLATMAGAVYAGYAHPFEHAPAFATGGLQVPAAGQNAVMKSPGGVTIDYTPMMFVTPAPNKDLLSGSPVMCQALDLVDLKGTVILDGNARPLDGAQELSLPATSTELQFSPAASSVLILARGSSSTVLLDRVELVPTRAGRFGLQEPLMAGMIGTLLAALVTVFFISRGRVAYQWLRRDR